MSDLAIVRLVASAAHQLGQIVGNWYEEHVAGPVLAQIAENLDLYCDSRFINRSCRGERVIWADSAGNEVDYDFVFELDGSEDVRGQPVAIFETFWRRYKKHSKDKARDDCGKLRVMRDTYVTVRHLGIFAAGDFTKPAQEFVSSQDIDLFYTPKQCIVSAWAEHDLEIEYVDVASEPQKQAVVDRVLEGLDGDVQKAIAQTVFEKIGPDKIESFQTRVVDKIGAMPQLYIVDIVDSSRVLGSRDLIDDLFRTQEPESSRPSTTRSYDYKVVFDDDDSFHRQNLEWRDLVKMHQRLDELVRHLENCL